jgi:hypothetical protein
LGARPHLRIDPPTSSYDIMRSVVLASPMLHANHQLIMERVATLRWPAMYQWLELAEEGGFAAYGPRLGSGEFP